jgi:hypothetical protein
MKRKYDDPEERRKRQESRYVVASFGRGISCSVESTNALKPGKYYRSTSSIVPSLLTWSWIFLGRGTHSLTTGSR